MSREQNSAFCSRKGLPRLSRERDGAFCSRKSLPRMSREQNSVFCSRKGLPRMSRERDGAFCHGRVCQGCLVSETARSAHGRVFRGCLVSETARSAHGRVFQGRLVSETARSAHERVCRCAFGRRRVCVVTEESRHPYVILPCTPERQKGAEVSPKRAAWHSQATKSAKSVAPECSAAPLGDGKSNKIITTKKSDCQFADSPTFFVYLSFETVPWGGARLGEGS